tara:strand:- start:601 stop:975 length:375 start_codon:yes stop_codon:yes gene_type:complete
MISFYTKPPPASARGRKTSDQKNTIHEEFAYETLSTDHQLSIELNVVLIRGILNRLPSITLDAKITIEYRSGSYLTSGNIFLYDRSKEALVLMFLDMIDHGLESLREYKGINKLLFEFSQNVVF